MIIKIIKDLFKKDIPRSQFIQTLRFLITGGITALFDFALLVTLKEFFGVHYFISAGIGFIGGSTLNYLFSIKWVFKSGKFSNNFIEFSMFLLFTAIGIGLNQITMYLSVEALHINYMISKVISIIIVTVFNYLSKRFIIFNG